MLQKLLIVVLGLALSKVNGSCISKTPDTVAPTMPPTGPPTPSSTPFPIDCPPGSFFDGYQCIHGDTCEDLFGPCDPEYPSSQGCICVGFTSPSPSPSPTTTTPIFPTDCPPGSYFDGNHCFNGDSCANYFGPCDPEYPYSQGCICVGYTTPPTTTPPTIK
jgi:hypothetical protein